MSYSLVISGNLPTLTVEFNSAIYLEEDAEYVVDLVNFATFNAIPNIDEINNATIFNDTLVITIPEAANNNTLHTHIFNHQLQ